MQKVVRISLVLTLSSLPFQGTSETLYFHNDHLGTPQSLTNSDREVVWEAEYDPFGKATEVVALVEQNIRRPGQYFDRETGLHYNHFRTYDPATGRYITSDPIGLNGGLSTYGYAMQNPNKYFDLFGLDVYICRRPVNIDWIPNMLSSYIVPRHTWIKTDTVEAGMGGECPVPGQGCADVPYVTDVFVIDHSGQSEAADSSCIMMNNVEEQCVNEQLALGTPLGVWNGFNQCQSFAWSVVNSCRTGPQLIPDSDGSGNDGAKK